MTILSIVAICILLVVAVSILFWLAGIVLSVGVFLLVGILIIKFLIVPYFEGRDKRRLDENHILIYAQKQIVRIDMNQTLSGFNPYVIDCYYTDEQTRREYVFTSKPFLTDPTPNLAGRTLAVFVNPEDYSNYYVDTSAFE